MKEGQSNKLFLLIIILLFGMSVKLLPNKGKTVLQKLSQINSAHTSAYPLNTSSLD